MRRAILTVAFLWLASPVAAAETVRLPTEADAVALALGAETVFFGAQGVETILPGPVRDREVVSVGLGPDGGIRRVEVVQDLVVTGLGDFQFKVAGPARDVEALPRSEAAPGLRRGSILWQGFSEGEELLAARMPLFAEQEAARLPVAFELDASAGGRPLRPDRPAAGPLELRLTVRNTTAMPIGVQRGRGDPDALAPALDAIHAALRAGERPAPGAGDVPERIPLRGEAETVVEEIESPFRVEGTISFPAGSVTDLAADGGSVSGTSVAFEALLGGGRPMTHTVVVRGELLEPAVPDLAVVGEPAPPDPKMAAPPGPGPWVESGVSGREMLDRAMAVLWRVARLRQFDGYLGNPDPDGPATTTYRFAPAAPRAAAAPPAPDPPEPTAGWVTAASWIGMAAALALAAVAWSRA